MNNTILPENIEGIVLPPDCSWDQNTDLKNKNGIVSIHNKDNTLYAKLKYHDNKLNGKCSFYNNDIVSYSVTFLDNIANGWASEYKNGEEYRHFLYENGILKSELLPKDKNYWEEIDIHSGKVLSLCSYDENQLRSGQGYLYEDGKISKVVKYANNVVVQTLKEFNNNVMKEFDAHGNMIYEGDYSDDYNRCGSEKELPAPNTIPCN